MGEGVRGRRRRRPRRSGWVPGVARRRSTARRGAGAAAAASANFEENSPNTRCWLRRSISPNVATSQKTVVPPLPSSDLLAVGQGEQLGQPGAEPRRRRTCTGAWRWLVPRYSSGSAASAVDRLGADLGRPAAEAAVGGSRSAGIGESSGRAPSARVCGHCRDRSIAEWHREIRCRRASPSARRRHRRIGHAGRRRQGQGAEGGGRERHRLRRRRARLPDARRTSSRRPSRPAGTRATTGTRRPPACPSCARPSPPRRCATPATECDAGQVLVTNGGKHAVFNAFAALLRPGRRGAAARRRTGPPTRADRASPAASRWSSCRPTRPPASGSPSSSSRRPARRGPRCCCSCRPSNPTGAVYPPRGGRGDRPVGASSTASGCVTDEIYEHLTYGDHEFTSMPTVGPRAGRPVRRSSTASPRPTR